MNKIVIILLLCLCSPCFADHQDLSFHQPNLGNTELYYNDVHKDLKIELKMEHSYEKNDIFIFPCEFYGESEYYRLGFYVDMDAVPIVCLCSKGRAGGLVEIRRGEGQNSH